MTLWGSELPVCSLRHEERPASELAFDTERTIHCGVPSAPMTACWGGGYFFGGAIASFTAFAT